MKCVLPVETARDSAHLQRPGVHEYQSGIDLHAKHDGAQPTHGLRGLQRQADQVIFADGWDVHRETVVNVGDVALGVVADELLGLHPFDGGDGVQEIDHAVGVPLVLVVEVHAVPYLLHIGALPVHFVLEDQLFQEEKCLFVVHPLSCLDLGLPHLLPRLFLCACLAHLPHHDELHNGVLLDDGARKQLLLHRHLHLEALGMRLRPQKACIHQVQLLKAFNPFEAEREELLGLESSLNPVLGRLEVALTEFTELHSGFL
mmetsp:Transcript_20329/g.35062  ORF Transcript_20329/g.35062 Transcript_20329/m.35062 type:complete len:259 (-) Transcript_20329:174-950(-)